MGTASGEPTPFDGQYVKEYDFTRDGVDAWGRQLRCNLVTTPNRDEALHGDASEMVDLWRQVDPRRPVREDGQPNRPLTAFSVVIE